MKTAIIKILTTPQKAAELCLAIFGEGTANPEAPQIEGFIAHCMLPIHLNGYTRVLIGDHYCDALDYLKESYTSDDVEVILVERNGQTWFKTGDLPGGGEEYLGGFSGHPVYQGA